MSTLGEIKSMIESELGRGATQTVRIANAIRQSGLWLERNLAMQYMHRFVTFTIDHTIAAPRVLPMPGRPRKFNFVRYSDTDGQYHKLVRVDPTEMNHVLSQAPTGYWVDGMDFLWLDSTPEETYGAEMDYWQFSNWGSMADSAMNWPMEYCDEFFVYESLLRLGATNRQQEGVWKKYGALRDEALRTMILADYDLQHGGEMNSFMEFSPTYAGTDLWPL